jgi:hypothetical protein
MPRYLQTLLASVAVTVAVSACSGSTQSGCTVPPVQAYPAVTLASPAKGATNVPTTIGNIIVESKGSSLYGTLTMTGGGQTITLNAQAVANSNGVSQFEAHVAQLQSGTTYSLHYTLTYPGACQGPPTSTTQYVGSFTTSG